LANCREDVVAVLNKAYPSQHECFDDRDRDGGSEKRANNTRLSNSWIVCFLRWTLKCYSI
jgi:hypothetical protein